MESSHVDYLDQALMDCKAERLNILGVLSSNFNSEKTHLTSRRSFFSRPFTQQLW